MLFNKHSDLVGKHAFLSASKYHWVNYTDEKLDASFIAALAAVRGTELHAFAQQAIRLGIKLPASRKTLNLYVNDAIGYKLTPEQIVFYSDNCFGTADAIGFRKGVLRIHDLKTGIIPCSVKQLVVYAAIFCLEYQMKPWEIRIELRIYQNDDVLIFDGDSDEIFHVMDKIQSFDKRINEMKMEAMS